MNNADMPAMPCQGSINRDSNEPQPYQFGNNDFVFPGMTKREEFAKAAMQGIMSDPQFAGDFSDIARCSVQAADALLAELEKEKKQ